MAIEMVKAPNIGGESDVEIIEISVKVGDTVSEDDTLITLESEKAAMDVPSPLAGIVKHIVVKLGDRISEGSLILELETDSTTAQEQPPNSNEHKEADQATTQRNHANLREKQPPSVPTANKQQPSSNNHPHQSITEIYAGPSVRRIAAELEIDLSEVEGSGDKNRITQEDLKNYLTKPQATTNTALPDAPVVDFASFGNIERVALSRINKLTGKNMQRNHLLAPAVSQFIEADITALEAFRQKHKQDAKQQGAKLTPLVFIMKAVVKALMQYPRFNASLSRNSDELIIKHYYHIGVAVDTKQGLVVPVVRDVEQKSLLTLAKELALISEKARAGKLTGQDMKGGCFTISSLGGIGGTNFTPVINLPEVAILGVSQATIKPIYDKDSQTFKPRLMLPLSVTYDHRVIDGAEGARFAVFLSQLLTDIRQLLL